MIQALLTGLATGAIYGLIAMSYAVVYYVTKVINFATGQLMMCSIMAVAVATMHGVSLWVAITLALGVAIVGAIVIYFLAVQAVLRFNRLSFAWLVSTLGVGIILESLAAVFWGTSSLPTPIMLNAKNVSFLGASLTWQQALSIILAVVLAVAVELFRRRTLIGKLGMAIATDPDIAQATGANVLAYSIGAFALGGLLVAVAGILEAPISFANPYLGETFGISGFVALMIGGIERPAASMGGGLLLGVLTIFASTYINPQAATWFPFVVVLGVLLIVPNGLFVSGGMLRALRQRLSPGARS
jgi:branched-chain amino acid transport system permease protein